MKKILLKDSRDNPSVTMTAFVIGFIVVNVKLLFSGITVFGFTVETFSGSSYGVALAALGAIYILRRKKGGETKERKE